MSARLCGDLGSSDPAVRVAAARELSRGMFWVGGTEQMFDAAEASCKKMGLGSR